MSLMEVKMELEHTAVMLEEVLAGLQVVPEGIYVDATFGRGGHAEAILGQLSEAGRLLVLDKDPEAIKVARKLSDQDDRVVSYATSFAALESICAAENVIGKVMGILMDLGVSSPQLDSAERGFSFRMDGPLDMRMDPEKGVSAADWLNVAEESEIAWVLRTYGEEKFHRRIARALVEARAKAPLLSTKQLAEIVSKANPAWEKHKHPATRSFQAIRIWINHELEDLSEGLEQALKVLAIGGRLVVISFHSLEDRIVKQFIQKYEKGDEYPKGLPILANELNRKLKKVGRFKPSLKEVESNVRSRSAVLRIAEKIGEK
jgi:16S rRNA (cytosine1402-N4)-methyltransferase